MARLLETDVLIIGGGGAGAKAALEAEQQGLNVLMLVKGFVGKTGGSIYAGNSTGYVPALYAGNTPGSSPRGTVRSVADDPPGADQWLKITVRLSFYLIDQDYAIRAAAYNDREYFDEMEQKGLYIRRMEDGSLLSNIGQAHITWAPKQGQTGVAVMDILRKEVSRRPIRVMEETTVTSLLKKNGEVIGATALDYRRGEFLAIKAKAVILATGHENYLSLRSTGTREQCGNGRVMAYKAGAELQSLEIQWYHVSDIAHPQSWMRLHLYPNPMPATLEAAHLVNSDGEFFFSQKMYPESVAPYYLQLKHLVKQVRKGKARWDGDYFTSFRHIDPETMREYSYQTQFYEKLGYDVSKDLIECGITWHMNLGGLRIDTKTMQTTLPGLFAAGAVGGHCIPPIAWVIYDGKVAGVQAAERAKNVSLPPWDESQIQAEEQRVLGLLQTEPREGYLPAVVKRRIREVMWNKMGYIKNESNMRQALDELHRIRDEMLPQMRLDSKSKRFNYDWVDALDAHDMVDLCQLIVKSSLYRKESRGPFYREDYPMIDNENWLKYVVVRREGTDPILFTVPVDTPYVKPDRLQEDFLNVDY